jgi:hypothetical protein
MSGATHDRAAPPPIQSPRERDARHADAAAIVPACANVVAVNDLLGNAQTWRWAGTFNNLQKRGK